MFSILAASGVSLTDVAALVTAVGGIIIGVLASRRTNKADRIAADVSEQSTLLEGYGQIVKDLQTEIGRIRDQYTQDQQSWRDEKELLISRIANLENELDDLRKEKRGTTRRKNAKKVSDPAKVDDDT